MSDEKLTQSEIKIIERLHLEKCGDTYENEDVNFIKCKKIMGEIGFVRKQKLNLAIEYCHDDGGRLFISNYLGRYIIEVFEKPHKE